MNQGTYPLAASMINQLNRVDVAANNLANSKTAGFKEEGLAEGSFNNYLKKAQLNGENSSYINEITNKVPKIDQKFIIEKQGAIIQTGNDLDFALTTPATYYGVLTQNGEIQYTRDGSFKNLDGFIVDSNGNNIISEGGEPLAFEDGFEEVIGVFKINSENIQKVGDNNYKLKDETREAQQVVAVEDNRSYILKGSIETSNVNAITAMVALIDAQRSLERAQKGLTGIDELNSTVIQKLGDNK